jgi:hypothetical protein
LQSIHAPAATLWPAESLAAAQAAVGGIEGLEKFPYGGNFLKFPMHLLANGPAKKANAAIIQQFTEYKYSLNDHLMGI